jgi:Lantibiotic dehydratase, N terminus
MQPSQHRIPLGDEDSWKLWRLMVLRSAGFPIDGVLRLADANCAAVADRTATVGLVDISTDGGSQAATEYATAYGRAAAENTHAISGLAADERFREAIAWQNRNVLHNCLDGLLDRAWPDNKRRRRCELVAAMYWQRYCTKNDTIGFFGPVGWAYWSTDVANVDVRPGPALLARRAVYLEGWGVAALAQDLLGDAALRPWLPPRRNPAHHLDGNLLHRPHGPPVRLDPAEAALLRACDGMRSARAVATELLRSAALGLQAEHEVLRILHDLCQRRLAHWDAAVPIVAHPEHELRQILEKVTEDHARDRALARLDELEAARSALAAAAGSAEQVDRAAAALEATFVRLTDQPPTRRHGQHYAGRTLAYEDCLRDVACAVGDRVLRVVAPPLRLLLDSARWLTYQTAEAYRAALVALYEQLAGTSNSAVVPFAKLSFLAHDLLFGTGPRPVDEVLAAFRERWSQILQLPDGQRRVARQCAALRPAVATAFHAPGPGWAAARHHSPDLLIGAEGVEAFQRGEFQVVVGELHVALNTVDNRCFVTQHPDPASLRRAVEDDIDGPRVVPVFPASWPDVTTRGYPPPALLSDRFHYLALGADPPGVPPPGRILPLAGLVTERDGSRLAVRTPDGSVRLDIIEMLGEFLTVVVVNGFQLLPPRPHTPRVTVDDVVILRESWGLPPSELPFAYARDRRSRYLAARRWARDHGLPRFLFVRAAPVEPKPIYVDLDSPVLVELLTQAIRRTERSGRRDAWITFTEMLPTPDQTWLPDAAGRRYTSELRLVAVDGADGGR